MEDQKSIYPTKLSLEDFSPFIEYFTDANHYNTTESKFFSSVYKHEITVTIQILEHKLDEIAIGKLQYGNHTNIVTILGIIEQKQAIVYQDFQGFQMTVGCYVNNCLRETVESFPILETITNTLQWLHSQNIIHGNINAETALVKSGEIKLYDLMLNVEDQKNKTVLDDWKDFINMCQQFFRINLELEESQLSGEQILAQLAIVEQSLKVKASSYWISNCVIL